MSKTIRVDEEVYNWLQSKAKPFEDTPNDVLRKIAKLKTKNRDSEMTIKTQVPNRRFSGRTLNKKWNVHAKHALYHKDGTWFNNLERFPGALFDPFGYIIFETEEKYSNSPYLNIGKETNVPNGISTIPGYVRMAD
ncbi:MAG: hypothetical protein WD357_09540 [Gracilimonas sp.]